MNGSLSYSLYFLYNSTCETEFASLLKRSSTTLRFFLITIVALVYVINPRDDQGRIATLASESQPEFVPIKDNHTRQCDNYKGKSISCQETSWQAILLYTRQYNSYLRPQGSVLRFYVESNSVALSSIQGQEKYTREFIFYRTVYNVSQIKSSTDINYLGENHCLAKYAMSNRSYMYPMSKSESRVYLYTRLSNVDAIQVVRGCQQKYAYPLY